MLCFYLEMIVVAIVTCFWCQSKLCTSLPRFSQWNAINDHCV